jgi:UDP-N-acetylmuramate dehydrogenase
MTVMKIQENFPLKNYNTFGVNSRCGFFIDITAIEQLQELLIDPTWKKIPKLILGEGSNILFSHDFVGLVIKMSLKGIQKLSEDSQHVWITAAAGENWHQLVLYCIKNNLAGIENLSLIPGTVGAAPIQNIGAYGVEFSEVFEKLTAIRISDGQLCEFDHTACCFNYRESIFKKNFKNEYIITSVTLRLNKKPNFCIGYGEVKKTLSTMNIDQLTIQAISNAVMAIRRQKLPDPKVIGNAGSFFMSPIISAQEFSTLAKQFPSMPHFVNKDSSYKIPAGWLIEQCGWKGRRIGEAGVYEHHALILINYGNSTGSDIKRLAEEIQATVKNKFAISLRPEVNII